ncbi:MAG: VOC family protein [Propionibacteriaceae bacterium]|nr:VOC family protein [Propionibacteriaceae bacterium]
MITALHTLVYADDPDAAREFFRDVLAWPSADTGGGWLIFRTGPSELGVHPTSGQSPDGTPWTTPERHEISLVCDDLDATMAELRERGAEFTREPRDDGFGITTEIVVPGSSQTLMLYQPHYDPPALSS